MVEKSCCRSHGQPVPGVRSCAMISSRREMSREGVMAHRSLEGSGLYAASGGSGPARDARYPQAIGLACGVTARMSPYLECARRSGVSLRQGETHMQNTILA